VAGIEEGVVGREVIMEDEVVIEVGVDVVVEGGEVEEEARENGGGKGWSCTKR
jgi:hypothetical protein